MGEITAMTKKSDLEKTKRESQNGMDKNEIWYSWPTSLYFFNNNFPFHPYLGTN